MRQGGHAPIQTAAKRANFVHLTLGDRRHRRTARVIINIYALSM
jgi:hypothetical protein